jgi:RNA polymerase sigma-70 factor (ECF subfamily)
VTGHQHDAEDIVEILFLKFLQCKARPEIRTNPKGYLYRAAVNESLNMIRSRARRKEDDGVENFEISDPGFGRVNDNVRARLQDAFAKLKPDVLAMVILHYEHGYSDAEIGGMLGQPRGKIAMILSRSRERLMRVVGRDERSGCKSDRPQPLSTGDAR